MIPRLSRSQTYVFAVVLGTLALAGCQGRGKTAETDAQAPAAVTATEMQEDTGRAQNVCAPEPYDAEENICPGGSGKGVLVDKLPADFVSKINWKNAECTLCSTFQGHNIYNCILPGANLRQAYDIAKNIEVSSELKSELPTAGIEYPCSGDECEKVVYEYYPTKTLYINTFYKSGGNVVITIAEGTGCIELRVTYALPLDDPDEDEL